MAAFDGLGKALRWIRDKQDKKQYQVAETASVTKAMLSAYETGKQKPSIETLEKILGALGVDLAGLFSALEVVNERAPVRILGASGIEVANDIVDPTIDVYKILGLERTLAPLEEEALAEMLRGFHKYLRHLHLHTEPPAAPTE